MDRDMSSLAIITARGGSKRIPHKNIRDFCGKPILAYSIEAAKASGVFNEIMVSTDSEEIASIAKEYGAKVPFLRSEGASNDFATTADVIQEVLLQYRGEGIEYGAFCCLYPTAPFVTAEKLQKAAQMLAQPEVEAVIPVVRFGFPPQRAFVKRDGVLQYLHPENERARSQDLEPLYHDAGQFYFCRTKAFLEQKTLVTKATVPLILPEEEVQDIDNFSDWAMAEMKYRMMLQRKESNDVPSL